MKRTIGPKNPSFGNEWPKGGTHKYKSEIYHCETWSFSLRYPPGWDAEEGRRRNTSSRHNSPPNTEWKMAPLPQITCLKCHRAHTHTHFNQPGIRKHFSQLCIQIEASHLRSWLKYAHKHTHTCARIMCTCHIDQYYNETTKTTLSPGNDDAWWR